MSLLVARLTCLILELQLKKKKNDKKSGGADGREHLYSQQWKQMVQIAKAVEATCMNADLSPAQIHRA